MYRKKTPSWMKHLDFEIFDIICMECAFFCAVILRHGSNIEGAMQIYAKTGVNLLIINLLTTFFFQNYKGILLRNKWQEITATFRHVTIVQVLFLLYEYFIKEAETVSRVVFVLSWGLSLVSCYFIRVIWKKFVRKKLISGRHKNRVMILTMGGDINSCLTSLYEKEYHEYEVAAIAVLNKVDTELIEKNVEVVIGKENIIEYIRKEVVDEVLIDCVGITKEELQKWSDLFLGMGVTIHISMDYLPDNLPNKFVERLGTLQVVTASIKTANRWEIVCKRLMDIAGGIVGLMLTGIAYIFVAPAIKIASPGPAFFKQPRVGKNGRIFYIYKFRSMYMDAEERKKELMKYNEMQGLMFKMENDPRIIGSEKGPGKGIGNFIRKTSIDELPQFWNILKGDMSLVGTRPPTLNEYEQYDLHHKIRLSAKPGLTGMWQTSGRNEITDFEEIVRLDTEYIENWSLKLDIKIILKTIKIVLLREGAK